MVEVDEKQLLNLEIRKGIIIARDKFEKYHNYYLNDSDIYLDIIYQIAISIMYYWEYNNIIDIIRINDTNIDINLLNKLLNMIKKETYMYGLRIIHVTNSNMLYIYIDKVYNNIYYVDDYNAENEVRKSLSRGL